MRYRIRRLGQPRRGATIVEFLVVVGVATLLLSLGLPAIQQARESARRVDCLNRLRGLGHAAHAHHDARQSFPGFQLHPPMDSPQRQLLPFLGETAVWSQIDSAIPIAPLPDRSPDRWMAASANRDLMNLRLNVFLCPSDAMLPGAVNFLGCTGYGPAWHRPGGVASCTDPGNAVGAFIHNRGTRLSDFRDGATQTALFSERVMGDQDPAVYNPWTDVYFATNDAACSVRDFESLCATATAGADHDSYQGATWLYAGFNFTLYNHLAGPNARMPDCANGNRIALGGGSGSFAARSFHTGGVNLCLADASTRFVSQQIDLSVWRALSTRAGKDEASFD